MSYQLLYLFLNCLMLEKRILISMKFKLSTLVRPSSGNKINHLVFKVKFRNYKKEKSDN